MLGTDLIEVKRVEAIIARYGKRFLDRLFTPDEQTYCLKHRDSSRHFAGRFAAKEAIVKALGTGISQEIGWLDIEIINDGRGKPRVQLSVQANAHFSQPKIELTISHCRDYAMAVALIS
ncbi:MAG: holo-ACP synthase [Parachlamydia sp.]|nr:holo-ACP synthase [Parachlamydia sp.]